MLTGNFQSLRETLTLSVIALFALALTACGGGGGGGGGSSLPEKVNIVFPTTADLSVSDINSRDFELEWVGGALNHSEGDYSVFLNKVDISDMFTESSTGATTGTFGLQVLLRGEDNELVVQPTDGQPKTVLFDAAAIQRPHPIVRSVEEGGSVGTVSIDGSIRQKAPAYDPLDQTDLVNNHPLTYKAYDADIQQLTLRPLPSASSDAFDKYQSFLHLAASYPDSPAELPATPDIVVNARNLSGLEDTVNLALPERLLSKAVALQLNNSALTLIEELISDKVESGGWLDTEKVFDSSATICQLIDEVKGSDSGFHTCAMRIGAVSFSQAVVTDLAVVDNGDGISGLHAKAEIQLNGLVVRPKVTAYNAELVDQGSLEFDLPIVGVSGSGAASVSVTLNVDKTMARILSVDLAEIDPVAVGYRVNEVINVTCDVSGCPDLTVQANQAAASGVLITAFRNYPIRIASMNDYPAASCPTAKQVSYPADCVYLFDLSGTDPILTLVPPANVSTYIEATIRNYKVEPEDEKTLLERIAVKVHDDIADKADDPEGYEPHYVYRAEDLEEGEPKDGAIPRSETLDVVKGSVVAEAPGSSAPKGAFIALDAIFATDNVDNASAEIEALPNPNLSLPEEYKRALGSYYQPTGASIVETNDVSSDSDDLVIALSTNYINQRLMEMYRQDFFGLQTHISNPDDRPTLSTCNGKESILGTLGASMISTLNANDISHNLDVCDKVELNMHALAVPYVELIDDGEQGVVQLNINALKIEINVTGKSIDGDPAEIVAEIDVKARMKFGLGVMPGSTYGLPHATIASDELSVLVAYIEKTPDIAGQDLVTVENFQPQILNMLQGELEELGGDLIEPIRHKEDISSFSLWNEPLFDEQARYEVELTGFGVDAAEEYLLLKGSVCGGALTAPTVACSASKTSIFSVELVNKHLDDFCDVYPTGLGLKDCSVALP